ncbi:MAG: arginine--tRNA ligase, partial [Burkholderiales bacterium]|nr:arginine--tRNA ligase [Burkholderiales bacterium]
MLTEHKNRLAALFQAAARQLIAQAGIELVPPVVELDRPKQASHGDLASNLALQLARALKSNPRQVAE